MSKLAELHKRWETDPDYVDAFESLAPEFAIARALIEARTRAGLNQAELAERMNTTQSAIARMESGKHLPSTRSLQRYAQATGSRLTILLEAADAS